VPLHLNHHGQVRLHCYQVAGVYLGAHLEAAADEVLPKRLVQVRLVADTVTPVGPNARFLSDDQPKPTKSSRRRHTGKEKAPAIFAEGLHLASQLV